MTAAEEARALIAAAVPIKSPEARRLLARLADDVDRLTAEVAMLTAVESDAATELDKARADNDRLRAALTEIGVAHGPYCDDVGCPTRRIIDVALAGES